MRYCRLAAANIFALALTLGLAPAPLAAQGGNSAAATVNLTSKASGIALL